VTFTKGKVSTVEASGNTCKVNFHDMILDDQNAAIVDADLVVLANRTGGKLRVDTEARLRAEAAALAGDNSQMETLSATEAQEGKKISILNLTYRQGPDLPQLKYGFNDSHFICLPV